MALLLPISSFDPHDYKRGEPGIQGLVDIVNWEVWRWDRDGTSSQQPLPRNIDDFVRMEALPYSHPVVSHLVPARTALIENLAMFSEAFMDFLLDLPPDPSSYLVVDTPTIMRHLRDATLRNEILPVLCGSATKNVGTELTMEYIGQLLASPLDVQHEAQSQDSQLRLLAWKVCWDKKKGWMTFVRVYSGMFLL
jgi:elongation factor G